MGHGGAADGPPVGRDAPAVSRVAVALHLGDDRAGVRTAGARLAACWGAALPRSRRGPLGGPRGGPAAGPRAKATGGPSCPGPRRRSLSPPYKWGSRGRRGQPSARAGPGPAPAARGVPSLRLPSGCVRPAPPPSHCLPRSLAGSPFEGQTNGRCDTPESSSAGRPRQPRATLPPSAAAQLCAPGPSPGHEGRR